MRILHCTVAFALAAAMLAGPGRALAQGQAGTPETFTVFLRGAAIGSEEVTVSRTANGTTIGGTAHIGPPLNFTVRRAEINYGPTGAATSCTIEGSVGNALLGIRTLINGTNAVTDWTEGTQTSHKTDQVSAGTLLLPNAFFGAYEALASRLLTTKPGEEVRAYVPPQAEIVLHVGSPTTETIRTPSAAVKVRRYPVQFANPGKPFDAEVWVEDTTGRLVRLVVGSQNLDYARNDIVSVASRREPVSHPGDEQVRFEANGFVLVGTLSKPTGKPIPKGTRLPAIVLVSGGLDVDRDEVIAGVPVLGQLASGLADAGFLVVRYDKRGVGQSGGRNESVTLGDYVDDVRAVVKGLRRRKDVDPKRIAVAGYGDGGAVAMVAAQKDGDIQALILLATPGVAGADFILDQQARALSKLDISPEEKQKRIDFQKKLIEAALTGKGWDSVPPGVRRQADTPWFQSFLTWNPAKVMPDVKRPVLIVTGSLDTEIPPDNARKLEALARARKKEAGKAVELIELPGLNHLFVRATTGEVNEYASLPDKTVSNALPSAIAKWLGGIWATGK